MRRTRRKEALAGKENFRRITVHCRGVAGTVGRAVASAAERKRRKRVNNAAADGGW